jgi:hypothetical protein
MMGIPPSETYKLPTNSKQAFQLWRRRRRILTKSWQHDRSHPVKNRIRIYLCAIKSKGRSFDQFVTLKCCFTESSTTSFWVNGLQRTARPFRRHHAWRSAVSLCFFFTRKA